MFVSRPVHAAGAVQLQESFNISLFFLFYG